MTYLAAPSAPPQSFQSQSGLFAVHLVQTSEAVVMVVAGSVAVPGGPSMRSSGSLGVRPLAVCLLAAIACLLV